VALLVARALILLLLRQGLGDGRPRQFSQQGLQPFATVRPNPGNPKPVNSMTIQRLFPNTEFFERKPVSLANFVSGNESTAHRSYDVCLMARQPMFEVCWREVSERELATTGPDHFLQLPNCRHLLRLSPPVIPKQNGRRSPARRHHACGNDRRHEGRCER
jgi:hypothetical protein